MHKRSESILLFFKIIKDLKFIKVNNKIKVSNHPIMQQKIEILPGVESIKKFLLFCQGISYFLYDILQRARFR